MNSNNDSHPKANPVRLNKYLADKNICSRREADNLIKEGKIFVNGQLETNLSRRVDPGSDTVSWDFDLDNMNRGKIYIKFFKPIGYVVSTSEEEGKTIFELLNGAGPVYPIGRLDKDSSGLLLLTNDSSLPKLIIGEQSLCEKEYFVRVSGAIPEGALNKLRSGIKLWGIKTRPAVIRREGDSSFFITLVEGKNRQIRRICQKVGYPVKQLHRIRVHTVTLGALASGCWARLSDQEIQSLKALSCSAASASPI